MNSNIFPIQVAARNSLRSTFVRLASARFPKLSWRGGPLLLVLTLLLQQGCQQQSPPAMSNTGMESAPTSDQAPPPLVPPTVSIDAPMIQLNLPENSTKPQQTALAEQNPVKSFEAEAPITERSEPGTLDWLQEEIVLLQATPKIPAPNATEVHSGTHLKPILSQEIDADRARRNHKVIELAQQIISRTHANPDQQAFFDNAVHALADSRLQLAIAGDTNQAQLLNEDAETLFAKDPNSFAAAEAAFKLLQFTQIQAQSLAAKDPKWALAFARQSRLFSNKFPRETNRAAIHLVAAGRICDKIGFIDEAKNCLLLVEERFPSSPFAEQVKNSLRRLRLPGQELLEFGGSTIDGNHISIDQYRGRPVIIAFWAANSIVFKEDMNLINEVIASLEGKAAVIGVNLDREEAVVQKFLALSGNTWPHIFYSAPNKRGMDNLIAKYYGVNKVPSYWLVDAQGIVKTVNLNPQDLRQHLFEMSSASN